MFRRIGRRKSHSVAHSPNLLCTLKISRAPACPWFTGANTPNLYAANMSAAQETPPRLWATRLTPARVVAFTVLASIPVRGLTQRLTDPDLWWHLRTGALIAERGIPRTDPYSYTANGKEWIVQEWGSEVILHWIREAFGLWGILAYRAVLLFAVYALVARLLVRRMGAGMGTWALLALTAYAGSANWTERPNLLSFLLFVVTLDLLDRRGRAVWWFVPLAAMWANLHGMVILGIGLVAFLAVVEGVKCAVRWESADAMWAKRLGLVSAASVLATFANPFGPRLLVHAFRLVGAVRDIASEWASPSFHELGGLVFLALLLLTVAALALVPERPDPTEVALALAFTFLALTAARNLTVSAIVLGLVCARALPGAIAAARARRTDGRQSEATPNASPLLGMLGFILAAGGLGIVLAGGLPRSGRPADIVDRQYPIEAIDALNRPGVRVYAWDFWSGMVIDRAWPNARVFIDLRWDFYGSTLARRYIDTFAAAPSWERNLDRACTTHVLVRPRDPLAQALSLDPDWRPVRNDARSVIFARKLPAPGCEAHPIPELR